MLYIYNRRWYRYILNDRKEEYINNDLNPCEENCNFTDYDYENNISMCSCKVKKKLKDFTEVNINKTLLYMSFTDIKHIMNLNVMKCYKKLFSKNGIIYNIGFYIILLITISFLIAVIIFYSKEYTKFISIITKLQGTTRAIYIIGFYIK